MPAKRTGRALTIVAETIKLPIVEDDEQPILEEGEVVLWKNTTTGKIYILASFDGEGNVGVELA